MHVYKVVHKSATCEQAIPKSCANACTPIRMHAQGQTSMKSLSPFFLTAVGLLRDFSSISSSFAGFPALSRPWRHCKFTTPTCKCALLSPVHAYYCIHVQCLLTNPTACLASSHVFCKWARVQIHRRAVLHHAQNRPHNSHLYTSHRWNS